MHKYRHPSLAEVIDTVCDAHAAILETLDSQTFGAFDLKDILDRLEAALDWLRQLKEIL